MLAFHWRRQEQRLHTCLPQNLGREGRRIRGSKPALATLTSWRLARAMSGPTSTNTNKSSRGGEDKEKHTYQVSSVKCNEELRNADTEGYTGEVDTHTVTFTVCPDVHSLLSSPTSTWWIPLSDDSVPSPSPPVLSHLSQFCKPQGELVLQKFPPLTR